MDYVKVARLERSVLRRVDAFTAITSGDLAVLSRKTPVRGVLATPPAPRQVLDRPTRPEFVDRPRRAVIVGSLMWRVKLGNLRSLLDVIATRLSDHGIEVVVAGTCADDDLHALRSDYPTVTFLGRVDDLGAVLDQGRVALLHEPAGGGFKMKIYDYISAGVPVVATSCSVADVQTSGGSMVHEVATTDELLAFVIAAIDDEVTLRRIRDDAHSAASVMGDGNAICESLEDLATVPTTQPRARR
jgi:glycosyltransferase involved in cell wall biosynthesis